MLTDQNVTRAAARMNVTQPTMSGMLQRLRYQFNDQILVRNGRHMELTPFAVSLVKPTRDAICGIDELMRAEPSFDPLTSTRAFRIMASDYCISVFMPFVAQRIGSLAPHVRIITQAIEDPVECLVSGTVDLCIWPADFLDRDFAHEHLQSEQLFSDSYVGIVSADHPISDAPSLEEFFSYRHVGVEGQGINGTIEAISLRQHARDFKPNFVVPEYTLTGYMVARSDLIGVLQARLASRVVAANPVRLISLPCQMPPIDEAMMWHRRHLDDPSHQWLRAFLAEVASSQL
ncbi:MAG: LysR family transcriptional regulator [Rhizorhabdus sp.]|nr:LysR family transcriptional regulator [Rhizorhabdus sp.]